MPGEPSNYTDIGGGGDLKPHGEDFFNRIKNVHWPKRGKPSARGIFIAASNDGTIHYLRVGSDGPTDDQTGVPIWQYVAGPFVDSRTGYDLLISGVACSPEVFVAVGAGGSTDGTGYIYASRDGIGWSQVYVQPREQEARCTGASVFAVTWDGSSFWAGAHFSLNRENLGEPGDHRVLEYDLLLHSSDGFSWAEVGRHEILFIDADNPGGPSDDYTRGLLADHCSSRVVNSYGNGLPDGYYGYADAGLLIAPSDLPVVDYFFGFISVYGGGITVQSSGTEVQEIPSDTGLSSTYAVAHADGIWVAAGGTIAPEGGGSCEAAILIPSSTTKTGAAWTRTNPGGAQAIVTICGRYDGPLK